MNDSTISGRDLATLRGLLEEKMKQLELRMTDPTPWVRPFYESQLADLRALHDRLRGR